MAKRKYNHKPTSLERFNKYVQRIEEGCWLWIGRKNNQGYGMFWYEGRDVLAHRFSYSHFVSAIPDGLNVCHSCDNPACCNPAHLWLGTQKENGQDMSRKGRSAASVHPERVARGERNGNHTHPEKRQYGEKAHNAKFTDDQVREIRRRYAIGDVTYKMLAAEYGVEKSTIGYIVRRKHWSHIA